MKLTRLIIPSLFGLGLAAILLTGVTWQARAATEPLNRLAPQASTRYVAPTGTNTGGCTSSASPCLTIQYAVDQAAAGDEIRVAGGTYTGVQTKSAPAGYPGPAVITQALYINKSVTIRGGYSAGFAVQDTSANVTTLDAQGQGRVVFIGGAIAPTIEGLRLTNGNATGVGGQPLSALDAGGGVYVITATATLRNLTVISNSAPIGNGFGGGVFLFGSASTLSYSTIQSNTADLRAGGIGLFECDDAVIVGNLIVGNTSRGSAGGVYAYLSRLSLSDNTIQGNTAFSGGGGVQISNSDLQTDHQPFLSRNRIISNTATYVASTGGGLYSDFSDPVMSGNVIQGNSAARGGGVYAFYSMPSSTNDVIRDNQATQAAPGMFLVSREDVTITIQHTTFAGNFGAEGSGLYVIDDSSFGQPIVNTVLMTNVIVVSHTRGITASAGNTVTLNGVLWFNNSSGNTTGGALMQASNAFTGNPQFQPDGYHLISPSLAINNGVSSAVSIDIDGLTRPMDIKFDLGADEYGHLSVYLPLVRR